MIPKQRPRAPKSWAYAYQLDPPQPEPRFAKLKMLLRRARLAAQRDGRLWTGQIVMEAHITHILVVRSEEHTSELQSRLHLVCRLLLEKKKKKISNRE